MSVDLKTISELREKTGAGIADCKSALEEAGGNIDSSIVLLRKKGEIKAAKKADRAVKEGIVAFSGTDKKCAVVALACETDFVSRGEAFQKVAAEMAGKLLISSPDEFKAWADGQIKELVLKIGENIQLAGLGVYEGETIGRYLHSNKKIGGIAAFSGGSREIADEIAMQIVAMTPKYLDQQSVPADVLEKEKEIYSEQLKAENKPAAIWDKIIEGKLNKFYEENCLINQIFIKDDAKKIKDLLGENKIMAWGRYQL